MSNAISVSADFQTKKDLDYYLNNIQLAKKGIFTGDIKNLIFRVNCFIKENEQTSFLCSQDLNRMEQLKQAFIELQPMTTLSKGDHQLLPVSVPTHRLNSIPVGLYNESGSDCFLNALRQFIYNTPLAQYIIPHLCPHVYSKTIEDFENYQMQKAATPMGGSRKVRGELMPLVCQTDQQDTHEALMQLSIHLDPQKNPLFNTIENTRSYDLDSLPSGINYEDFTLDSQESLKISQASPDTAVNISQDENGPLAIDIKPDQGPVYQTMQEVWDNFMNPKFTRKELLHACNEDVYGAYLKESTSIDDSILNHRRIVKTKTGKVKVVPDKIGEYFRFKDLPQHLVFILKRYSCSEHQSIKIKDLIDVDETFRLNHRHVKTGKAANFRIRAFIVQSGTIGQGHYYTYVLQGNKWYKCDDSSVYQVSKENAKAAMRSAYTFYAQREGKVSQFRKLMVRPYVSSSESFERTLGSLVDKPKIDTTIFPLILKEEIILGTVNQNEVQGGKDSCSAQALGFLMKILHGEVVNESDIRPMLERNAQKFQDILIKQKKQVTYINKVVLEEIGYQSIIGFIIKEIEIAIYHYNMFKKCGVEKNALDTYLQRISRNIIKKYQAFYPKKEVLSIQDAVTDLFEQRIQGSLTKIQLFQAVQKFLETSDISYDKHVETIQRLYNYPSSSEEYGFFSVYLKYQSYFGSKQHKITRTVYLDSDHQMREAIFGSIFSELKQTYLLQIEEKSVGLVMTVNSFTYSLALVKQKDGSILYQVYHSRGNPSLTGKNQAFIFRTKNAVKTAQFLNQLIHTEAQVQTRNKQQNILNYHILTPSKPDVHPTVSCKAEEREVHILTRIYSLVYYNLNIIKIPFLIGRWLFCRSKRLEK